MNRSTARAVHSTQDAGSLDTTVRRWLYHPERLAARYVKPGDRVLDFGCGPGFFTRSFARRVGDQGRVIAVDLQQGMLDLVRRKVAEAGLSARLITHLCKPDALDLGPERDGQVDVAFALFVVHEVPDRAKLFREIAATLRSGGTFFYSEPPFLVGRKEFDANVASMKALGLEVIETRWFFLNRAVLLRKRDS